MILQNCSLDQDKSFQKLLSLELGHVYLAHCTIILYALHVIFTLDILKKNCQKINLFAFILLFSICKYFTIYTCSKPMSLSLSALKASYWLVMYYSSKMNLHSPDFLSFTQQLLDFIFVQLLTAGGLLLICTCLKKYHVLLSFYLKGDKEEVQAKLVSTCHCKSLLVQAELVIVGKVNATVSATIKNHMEFISIQNWLSHCIFNQKKVIFDFFLKLSENIMHMLFQVFLPEKKKEDHQPHQKQKISLIKSRKWGHKTSVSRATEV